MKRFIKQLFVFALAFALLIPGTISFADEQKSNAVTTTEVPKYVIYLIGDGMGASHRALAQYYNQYTSKDNSLELAMNQLPYSAEVTTHCSNSYVTDSAAAGTALATGHKTGMGVISMDETGKVPYKTLLEAAQEKGMATGLITTVTMTHATPATFGAHSASRGDEAGIALDYLESGINYFAGGGLKFFLPVSKGGTRSDNQDLLGKFEKEGYTVLTSRKDFNKTDFTTKDLVLGLYSQEYFENEIDQINAKTRQTPELYEMLEAGIEVLSHDQDGFFVMCEGGKIDEVSHSNDTASVIQEVLAFDKAVQVAVDFYEKHPTETLIIVGADHETGGLTLSNNSYSLNLVPITKIKCSVAKISEAIKKNPKNAYKIVEAKWHITLSKEDKELMDQRVGATKSTYQSSYMYNLSGWALAPALSKTTLINWGTMAHTAETVPFTAIGVHAELLSGYQDNTEIAKNIAKIMGVQLDD